MRRRWGAVLVAAVVLLLASSCQPTRLRSPVALPDGQRNFPDPTILAAEGAYWAYSTNSFSSPPRNVQVMSSSDLERWEDLRDALPVPPSWAWAIGEGGEFWAPTVERFGSTYVLYFAARHRSLPAADDGWCIGTATSVDPAGPFSPSSAPLLCRVLKHVSPSPLSTTPAARRGVIDPQVYRAPNGEVHLLVKANDNPFQLWSARLTSTGTSLTGDGHGLVHLDAKVDTWEYSPAPDHRFTILENPSMDHNPAAAAAYGLGYLLYYSGGDWRSERYATGVAACASPRGPCVRAADEPWLSTRGDVAGPGGLSVFRDLDGQRRVAYHSWERGEPISAGRRLHVEPLGYDGALPLLLDRRPSGPTAFDLAPERVLVGATLIDPDRAVAVEASVAVDGTTVATATTDADGVVSLPAEELPAGDRRVCVRAVDDNGLGTGTVRCVSIDVPPAGGPDPTFWDVSWRHPFLDDVEWMAAEGISLGYADLGFRPSASVSRQAMAAFLHRLAGSPAAQPSTFRDVGPSHPFRSEIDWLAGSGIATGYPDGSFRPGEAVSRQAMAAFVHRTAGAPAFDPPATPSFRDVAPTHPFLLEVEWMAATGISTGYRDGTFRPGEAVSRQAMAAFLHRLVDGPGVGVATPPDAPPPEPPPPSSSTTTTVVVPSTAPGTSTTLDGESPGSP